MEEKREKKLIAFPWRCKMNRNDREKDRERERERVSIVEKSIISSGLDPPSTLKDVCLL